MLNVPPLPRSAINAWPLAEAGFPVRVVNSARAAGIETTGALRSRSDADLLRLRSFGRISLKHIHTFFDRCHAIERGELQFDSIRDVLDLFLDEVELSVLTARYGFYAHSSEASRAHATLQEIGNAQNRTRERVRQVEEAALRNLSSRLAQHCLAPCYGWVADRLRKHGLVLTEEDLAEQAPFPVCADYQPAGILLLLRDLAPARLTFLDGIFTLLPVATLQQLHDKAVRLVTGSTEPVALSALVAALDSPDPGFDRARALSALLDRTPGVVATRDQRYLPAESGIGALLVEIFREHGGEPMHFRSLAAAFNERVLPRSQRGAGYILGQLNQSTNFLRGERGHYAWSGRET